MLLCKLGILNDLPAKGSASLESDVGSVLSLQIAKEQGLEVLPEHDPIRDQSWYVNKKLRQRLLDEYGVKTCTVIQFLGDAIILPAGALHQVTDISLKTHSF